MFLEEKDQLSLYSCCKCWRSIAYSNIRFRLQTKDDGTCLFPENLAAKTRKVTLLQNCSLVRLLSPIHLRKLLVQGLSAQVSFFRELVNLKSLVLSINRLMWDSLLPTSVRKLRIYCYELKCTQNMELPALNHLTLSYQDKVPGLILPSSLEILHLKCANRSISELVEMTQALPNLYSLKIKTDFTIMQSGIVIPSSVRTLKVGGSSCHTSDFELPTMLEYLSCACVDSALPPHLQKLRCESISVSLDHLSSSLVFLRVVPSADTHVFLGSASHLRNIKSLVWDPTSKATMLMKRIFHNGDKTMKSLRSIKPTKFLMCNVVMFPLFDCSQLQSLLLVIEKNWTVSNVNLETETPNLQNLKINSSVSSILFYSWFPTKFVQHKTDYALRFPRMWFVNQWILEFWCPDPEPIVSDHIKIFPQQQEPPLHCPCCEMTLVKKPE